MKQRRPILPGFIKQLRSVTRRRTKPGTRPGVIVVDPDSPPPRIQVITYSTTHASEHDVADVDQITEFIDGGKGITWVNVDGLGDAKTLERLAQIFSLHNLVLEDIVNVHQRAKVEEYSDHLYVVMRMVRPDDHASPEQISMIISENLVLTCQERPGDCLEPVRRRIQKGTGRIRSAGADYLAYALIDAIIDGYFPVVEALGERLEDLEDQLLSHATSETAAAVHRLRSEYFVLRKSIWPHREAVNTLLRDSTPFISADTRVYLRDCYDHVVQLIDITETGREMCSDLRDFHFSQISIRQNEVMKVLTIVATIFIPLGFIAGVYGMNFDPDASPWNMPETKWSLGYPFALALMAAVGLGMIISFWLRGWLGPAPRWFKSRTASAQAERKDDQNQ